MRTGICAAHAAYVSDVASRTSITIVVLSVHHAACAAGNWRSRSETYTSLSRPNSTRHFVTFRPGMCGIWGYVCKSGEHAGLAQTLSPKFWAVKRRGPDYSRYESFGQSAIGFHRLAIMDRSFKSNQPYVLQTRTKTVIFVCNGEIYNYLDLIERYSLDIEGHSDCLTIPHLYLKYGDDAAAFCKLFERDVKGEFAFVLYEYDVLNTLRRVVMGRDQIGVRPLYWFAKGQHEHRDYGTGRFSDLLVAFSSELKGLEGIPHVDEFQPGTVAYISLDDLTHLSHIDTHRFQWVYATRALPGLHEDMYLARVREAAIAAVRSRLHADRPIAFLLSGGVDSSLVCGIASKLLKHPIKTFCCGMEDGTDRAYARKVANHIGSTHTEVTFTASEALDLLDEVVYATETWDTTTVRASTGQFIVCRHIGKNTDCKVVLVGEGPDEVCSSYLFNWYCPSAVALHDCALEYVRDIHCYDVKRADRCISYWGLEGRVPFLDPEFIQAYWTIPADARHPAYKGIEKWWLRKAFEGYDLIPDEVLWRKKEAFSDGISGAQKSWFQIIQEKCEHEISDEALATANNVYNDNTPRTKEALYFRHSFNRQFPGMDHVIPRYWLPKFSQNGSVVKDYVDPSARTLEVYTTSM